MSTFNSMSGPSSSPQGTSIGAPISMPASVIDMPTARKLSPDEDDTAQKSQKPRTTVYDPSPRQPIPVDLPPMPGNLLGRFRT